MSACKLSLVSEGFVDWIRELFDKDNTAKEFSVDPKKILGQLHASAISAVKRKCGDRVVVKNSVVTNPNTTPPEVTLKPGQYEITVYNVNPNDRGSDGTSLLSTYGDARKALLVYLKAFAGETFARHVDLHNTKSSDIKDKKGRTHYGYVVNYSITDSGASIELDDKVDNEEENKKTDKKPDSGSRRKNSKKKKEEEPADDEEKEEKPKKPEEKSDEPKPKTATAKGLDGTKRTLKLPGDQPKKKLNAIEKLRKYVSSKLDFKRMFKGKYAEATYHSILNMIRAAAGYSVKNGDEVEVRDPSGSLLKEETDVKEPIRAVFDKWNQIKFPKKPEEFKAEEFYNDIKNAIDKIDLGKTDEEPTPHEEPAHRAAADSSGREGIDGPTDSSDEEHKKEPPANPPKKPRGKKPKDKSQENPPKEPSVKPKENPPKKPKENPPKKSEENPPKDDSSEEEYINKLKEDFDEKNYNDVLEKAKKFFSSKKELLKFKSEIDKSNSDLSYTIQYSSYFDVDYLFKAFAKNYKSSDAISASTVWKFIVSHDKFKEFLSSSLNSIYNCLEKTDELASAINFVIKPEENYAYFDTKLDKFFRYVFSKLESKDDSSETSEKTDKGDLQKPPDEEEKTSVEPINILPEDEKHIKELEKELKDNKDIPDEWKTAFDSKENLIKLLKNHKEDISENFIDKAVIPRSEEVCGIELNNSAVIAKKWKSNVITQLGELIEYFLLKSVKNNLFSVRKIIKDKEISDYAWSNEEGNFYEIISKDRKSATEELNKFFKIIRNELISSEEPPKKNLPKKQPPKAKPKSQRKKNTQPVTEFNQTISQLKGGSSDMVSKAIRKHEKEDNENINILKESKESFMINKTDNIKCEVLVSSIMEGNKKLANAMLRKIIKEKVMKKLDEEKQIKQSKPIIKEASGQEPNTEYQKCQKTQYSVQVYTPSAGTKVHNKLENSDYVVNEKKPFVLVGTVGEEWTVDANKLKKTYLLNGKEITDEVLQTLMDGKKHTISTKKDAGVNWCKFVPKDTQCEVATSWGETLEVNRSGIPHGDGDYIVTADDGGKPNLEDRWVVNGEIFAKTYKILDKATPKKDDAKK